ncbi:Peptidase family M50 [uncultured archaeon]|nr:Peptidase family M50 [uncultured archaeon]
MPARVGLSLSKEVEDIIIADLALTFAFMLVLGGGITGIRSSSGSLPSLFVISLVAVSLSFILHEMMHKFVAQHFGAIAAFRKSDNGIIITLITAMFGFMVGIPGATVIYTQNFTKKEDGYVSLAGPLTNFAVFAVFFAISMFATNSGEFVSSLLTTTMLVSLILAFFNMLPIYPLDGSKVLRWNKAVYVTVLAVIFALLLLVFPTSDIIFSLAFMLAIAFVMSLMFRGISF